MRIPLPTDTQEVFNGGVSSALECLSDRIDRDDLLIEKNATDITSKFQHVDRKIVKLDTYARTKEYKDTVIKLVARVKDLEESKIEHDAVVANTKYNFRLISGVFAFFIVIIWSMSSLYLSSYLAKLDAHETEIEKLQQVDVRSNDTLKNVIRNNNNNTATEPQKVTHTQ